MPIHHLAIIGPPVPGHYDPLKVLARALEDRALRVTFVHMADAGAALEGFGFEPVGARTHGSGALKRYTDVLARASRPAGFLTMIRATAAITRMLLEDLPDALERIGADAVIADSTEPAGGLVAQHLGLPWATSVTGLPLLREAVVPPPFIGWPFQDDEAGLKRNRTGYAISDFLSRPITRQVERFARRWGLDPQAHQGFSPALQVAQCPAGLDFPRRERPAALHYCGPWREAAQGPLDLPIGDGRPLVYCSLGSLQGNRPAMFAAMTRACADLGARAVVAHGGRLGEAATRDLPGDPIVRAHWHQPSILPLCSAAILHAGFNTVLDALGGGVPMLVAPIAFEQPGTAARVAHIGAGRILPRRRDVHVMRAELQALLAEPAYRRNAEQLSGQMAKLGGVDQAAGLIERLFRPVPV